MVRETNQQAHDGEATSSRSRKRQRLPFIVQEGGESGNGGGTVSGNQNRSGDEVITEVVRSGTLLDLKLLDCPVCCDTLTAPIFQCDNGHIACSSCSFVMRNKCPRCPLPIGYNRCRQLERVIEATMVPCTNAKHGCTQEFSYGKVLRHEKECGFALCYCPAPNCSYTGVYKDLSHYYANHKDENLFNFFTCGRTIGKYCLNPSDKILVLQESPEGPLVVVQCFREGQGIMYLTVNSIAPLAPGVGRFSCHLSCKSKGTTMSFELEEMNRIQKLSFETPKKDFMVVPDYVVSHNGQLEMNICIRRLEEKKEEANEEEEDEDEAYQDDEEEQLPFQE